MASNVLQLPSLVYANFWTPGHPTTSDSVVPKTIEKHMARRYMHALGKQKINAMAHDTDKMIQQSLAVIKKHKLVFIEDIISLVAFSKQCFYDHNLDENDAIKSELEKNRINMKRGLRVKWYNNDNATTQIALYKLIGTDAELERLSISKHQIETIREQPLFPDENQNADEIQTNDGDK